MHRRSFLGARLSVAGVRLLVMDLKGSSSTATAGEADWSGFKPDGAAAPARSAVEQDAATPQSPAGRCAVDGVAGDPFAVLCEVAETLTGAPLWWLSDDAVTTRLRDFEVVRARLDAHRLALLRELDTRGWAARVGACSTASWVAQALRVDPRAAAADVRAAWALDPAGDVPPAPGLPAMTGVRFPPDRGGLPYAASWLGAAVLS